MTTDGLADADAAEVAGDAGVGRSRLELALDRGVGAASWLWVALLAVIVASVLLRTLFSIARIELEELQWHLYAVGFLAGILGGVLHDRHVRVDVLRERMPGRRRDWIELYGLLLLQLPFLALVLWSALPLVAESLATSERSTSAGGLPARWLVKSALPMSALLLLVASLARLRRVARRLFADGAGDGAAAPPRAGRSLGGPSR
ncbi:MAG: TRAP transporter small permease subunit [Myxococcota bacterium]